MVTPILPWRPLINFSFIKHFFGVLIRQPSKRLTFHWLVNHWLTKWKPSWFSERHKDFEMAGKERRIGCEMLVKDNPRSTIFPLVSSPHAVRGFVQQHRVTFYRFHVFCARWGTGEVRGGNELIPKETACFNSPHRFRRSPPPAAPAHSHAKSHLTLTNISRNANTHI